MSKEEKKRVATWPIWIIATAAAVTVWSGWVGLGSKTGFGVVHPLPGLWDDFSFNLAITLPIGMEAYASYAIWISLNKRASDRTRLFARTSYWVALAIGAAGQVAFHVMESMDVQLAPVIVTIVVSILPVAVLGLAMTLAHMIREDEKEEDQSKASSVPVVERLEVPELPAAELSVPPVYPTVHIQRPESVHPDPPQIAPLRPIRNRSNVSMGPRDYARSVFDRGGTLEVGDMYEMFPNKSKSSLRSALYAVKNQYEERNARNREVS